MKCLHQVLKVHWFNFSKNQKHFKNTMNFKKFKFCYKIEIFLVLKHTILDASAPFVERMIAFDEIRNIG